MKEMISAKESEDSIQEKLLIKQSIDKALQQNRSFSLWKTPGENELHLIVCHEPIVVEEYNLEEGIPGFAFAPFNPDGKKYLFPADVHYVFKDKIKISGPDDELDFHSELSQNHIKVDQFHYKKSTYSKLLNNYIHLVELCLSEISSQQVEKIVPSRFKEIPVSENLDLFSVFDSLCARHPQALVSFISSPQTGTWLGASPELLVSVDDQNIFRTNSLAGTQPYSSETDLKSVAWKEKEIEEQALVSRYIINCFKKIRLREYEEHGPRTMVAGNVMHLKTIYEVDMNATNFPQLGSVMLKLLHPTSAVCGMPFDNAFSFLKQHEGYDREFYSGYLGPQQINRKSNIYVNLRCMQLSESSAKLYAGAGVTVDSSPEKEFEETEIKMQNLQSLIVKQ